MKKILQTRRKIEKTEKIEKTRKLSRSFSRSFSPKINKFIDITSLKTMKINTLNVCDNLLLIDIGNKSNVNCLPYNNEKVVKFLLNNLKASKHLDPTKFIAPKQLYANCWFNTMFVTFFFSDKGRKFFRFFRNLMITGKKNNGEIITNKELRKLFFILNLYIEASYNQSTSNNKKNLYHQIKYLTNSLDTNFFIKRIYLLIANKLYRSIPNIKDPGNPLEYYKRIINYLNYDKVNILNINISSNLLNLIIKKNEIQKYLQTQLDNKKNCPDILILEDHESGIYNKTELKFNKNDKVYKYILDAIILTNKDFYKPKKNKHFVSTLTINNKEYKFDGSSYAKLSRFNWKNIINRNIDWEFRENPNYIAEKYNFTKGYKLLFYYRV